MSSRLDRLFKTTWTSNDTIIPRLGLGLGLDRFKGRDNAVISQELI